MPKPNANRTIGAMEVLAARITYERSRRGQTQRGLAKLMEEVGCSIQHSAIGDIEKGRRGIDVDELAGFAEVWGMTAADLMRSTDERVEAIISDLHAQSNLLIEATLSHYKTTVALLELMGQHPEDQLGRYVAHKLRQRSQERQATLWQQLEREVPDACKALLALAQYNDEAAEMRTGVKMPDVVVKDPDSRPVSARYRVHLDAVAVLPSSRELEKSR